MGPPVATQSTNILPPKEHALFKRIVKCYEQKQYKNGLKFAKQILSNAKFSEHGETLAMKGLILNCLGKKDDAYDHARRGLRSDVRSHVCWHVFGLIQRSDKKYDEAIKAYRNALKIDKENLQILRDLSLLQLQMRDLEGYKETRYLLFSLRPAQKASWITFAMAHHLLEDYDTALKLIEEYRRTQEQPVKTVDQEYSELLLYQNSVLRESGKFNKAYQHLETYSANILDKLAVMEIKGDLLMKLDQKSEAAEIYRKLIDRNSENAVYYKNLEICTMDKALDADEILNRRLKMYDTMCKKHSRAFTPKRLPLTFTQGAMFLSLLNVYAKNMLRKGVPPLFISLRSLYKDTSKVLLIEDLFLSYANNLEKCQQFPGDNEVEAPTTLLWVYYYLALHYDYLKSYAKALTYLDKANEHTPTLIEILTARAKVYKHTGDYKQAFEWMEEAQSLDTADRYVNSKCAKYMLKAGMFEQAEQMCGKFTREGSCPTDNLNEMQCMWFQAQCAQSYFEANKLGEALKKCHEMYRHFTDIIEDQFDFHTYCVRRMTLCAYIKMLRLEDTLQKHRWYFKAAKIAIMVYIRLHDKPYDETELNDDNVQNETKTSEAKKQRRKEKKQQMKNEQMLKAQNTSTHPNANKAAPAKKDDQEADESPKQPLDPKILVKPINALDEAVKFLKPLISLNSPETDSYLLGFEVYCRRNKLLMMLHCLKRAHRIDPQNSILQECKEKFLKYISMNKCDSSVLEIVMEEMEELFKNDSKPSIEPPLLEE